MERRELIVESGITVKVNEQRERQFTDTEEGSQRTLLAHAAPPIITPEIANAVKRRLEYNQQTASRNNKHSDIALLRGGLARCSLWGGTMVVQYVNPRGILTPIYRCGHSHATGAERSCTGTSITVAKMDVAVCARAMQVIQNPKILREEAEKRMSDSGKLSTIEGYKKTIAELEGREASLAEAIGRVGQSNGYGMDSLLAQLNKVGEEKEETLKKLKKAQKEYRDFESAQQRLLDVEVWCVVAATIDRESTFEEKRIILFGLNTRVTVYPHGHVPRYRIRMGNEEDETLVPSLEEDETDMGKGAKAKRLRRRAESNGANCVPDSKLIGLAKLAAQKLEDAGLEQQAVLDRLDMVRANPDAYLNDPVMANLARECVRRSAADPARMDEALRERALDYGVWGSDQIDPAAIAQMENALRLPVAVAGALMPDAHVGYGLPIGGVLATHEAVIPYAVGVDIACRMRLSLYDVAPRLLDERKSELARALREETRFGAGAAFERNRRPSHEVLDDADWKALPLLKSLQGKAQEQLGSSGTGNHFVEWGTFRLYADDPTLGLKAGEYLALLSHSGSRGVGFKIANTYTEIARRLHPRLDKSVQHLAWLPLASEPGQEYWLAMELAGRFASANHFVIHQRVARAAGLREMTNVENYHNFAWTATLPDGSEAIVHRKGATPAEPGVLGVIPGSMGDAGYVVRGRGEASSLQSASHGAGRKMSRKAAINSISKAARDTYLRERGITLLGGGMDESPQAYKDIEAIIAAQDDLVEVIGKFTPRIVRMADEAGEY